jgi:uncharacterized protein (TIGR03437 family)
MRIHSQWIAVVMMSAPQIHAQAPGPVTVVNYSGYAPSGQAATAATAFPVAPGSIASAYGTFAAVPEAGASASTLNPMPAELGGVRVRIGSAEAPLYFASRSQINFVVPNAVPAGRHNIEVVSAGNVLARGSMQVYDIGPALASSNPQTQQAIAQNQDFGVNGPSSPARRGQVVQLYATGCGRTNPPTRDGTPPTSLSPAAGEVKVYFGPVEGAVQFAGAHPQFPGICQINATIPENGFLTGRVPVFFTVHGVPSNPVSIQVQ